MRTFILFIIHTLFLFSEVREVNITPSPKHHTFKHIKILDQKELRFSSLADKAFLGLSDVAYDVKSKKLYFVGDRGMLYLFNASFSDKIDRLCAKDAKFLKNKKGKVFRKWRQDAEGMVLDNKGRLLISFEGEAKIGWFHKNGKTIGKEIRRYTLPKALRKSKAYRSANKSLEALAYHPRYGILTAAEWPLKSSPTKRQTIYALSGKQWHFMSEPEAKSAVVAMEVMPDGNLLVLERSFNGLFAPFVITLKKVMIEGCKQKICPSEVLLKMNNHKGWDVDNFEGLAHIEKNRYVMVSDDNGNFFQKTLLLYFEVR